VFQAFRVIRAIRAFRGLADYKVRRDSKAPKGWMEDPVLTVGQVLKVIPVTQGALALMELLERPETWVRRARKVTKVQREIQAIRDHQEKMHQQLLASRSAQTRPTVS
jgi:hypothetical protein